nr:unnamed protein product [Callosobruchus chinensis]
MTVEEIPLQPSEKKDIPEVRAWRRGKPQEQKPDLEEVVPALVPTKVEEIEEVPVAPVEKSEKEITLVDKRKKIEKVEKIQEKVPEEETVPFTKDMDVKIASKKVTLAKKKTVSFEDTQPIPELEIISQKERQKLQIKFPRKA